MLIYAIGDLHGRRDLLSGMLELICQDVIALRPGRQPLLIFLGDYVDRGPDSRGVIECIVRLASVPAFTIRALKGNHEVQMMRFLENASAGPTWAAFGGLETLASYGVSRPPPTAKLDAWERAREDLLRKIPGSHMGLLTALEINVCSGDYFFVHAGVRPGVDLDQQSEDDMLWIREEFLSCKRSFGKVIVHGHTPMEQPELLANRIGIDTGAYATGVLTAVRLMREEREILQFRA